MTSVRYLLDSNFLITAFRVHYPFDVVPSFWRVIKDLANKNIIGSIDKVCNEIEKGKDELTEWCKNELPSNFFLPSDVSIIEYGEVMRWAQSKQGHYKPGAINEFSQDHEADAWLVSMAKLRDFRIVSYEASQPDCKRRIPLPQPCEHFNVGYLQPVNLFRELHITF